MAVLEKIRSKGVLLLVIIGVALLAFVGGDLLTSRTSFFGNPREIVGKINGKSIKYTQLLDAIDQLTEVYQIETGRTVDDNVTEYVRERAWEEIVNNKLLFDEVEKIGLTVRQKELADLTIENNNHPIIHQIFTDPNTGQYNKESLKKFLSDWDDEQEPEVAERYKQIKNYWLYFENLVKSNRLREKYQTLLTKAVNVNSLEAKFAFDADKTSVDLQYVMKPYYSVQDANVTVSDSEISRRYKRDKEQYKQTVAGRGIEYVSFPTLPSQEDFEEVSVWIEKLKPEFETDDDVIYLVNTNSDAMYKDIALSADDIDPDLQDFAFSGSKGQVFGPELLSGSYKMAKIIETGIFAPDSVNVRHIAVYEATPEETKALADSLMNVLKTGGNFEFLAAQFSKAGTGTRGGEIGWMREHQLSPEIGKAAFKASVNQYFTVEEQGAIHIMEVTEKTKNVKKVKLAVIQRSVDASSRTQNSIFSAATQFADKAKGSGKFAEDARAAGYVITPSAQITESQARINGIKNSRQIVRWAYESKKNEVSDVFECDNQFIVANLTEINKEGYKPLESVSEQIKAQLITEKKGELIAQEMRTQKALSLEALAQQLGTNIDTLTNVSFSANSIGRIGNEATIIGTAPFAQPNQLSAPLIGKAGVYVYKVFNKTENPVPFNETMFKQSMGMRYGLIPSVSLQELREKGNIIDKRSNLF